MAPTASTPKKETSWTFYLYCPDGTPKTRRTVIAWPFGERTIGRTRQEDGWAPGSLKNIVFDHGSYTTEDPDVVAFLEKYNTGGAIDLSFAKGRFTIGANFLTNIIKKEKPSIGVDRIVEKEVTVEKFVIPKFLADSMDVSALRSAATNFGLSIPDNIIQKSEIIELLEKEGYVKDLSA